MSCQVQSILRKTLPSTVQFIEYASKNLVFKSTQSRASVKMANVKEKSKIEFLFNNFNLRPAGNSSEVTALIMERLKRKFRIQQCFVVLSTTECNQFTATKTKEHPRRGTRLRKQVLSTTECYQFTAAKTKERPRRGTRLQKQNQRACIGCTGGCSTFISALRY